MTENEIALNVAIAALGGAAVGVERQWSGNVAGPHRDFAGVRTFTLLGAIGGAAGALWSAGLIPLATVLVAGVAALIVAAYVAASRVDIDGTTEVAALLVVGAGTLSGLGNWRVGSAIAVATALLLAEKSRVHQFVYRITEPELRAGLRFAVMAVVVLPLLPVGPYGPWGGIKPRELWALVLFFSGLSFAGYIARSAAGPKGYVFAGLLGGLISSTNVTYNFSRTSRTDTEAHRALALGVLIACSVMYFRVLAACAVLYAPLALAAWPYLAAPAAVGCAIALVGVTKGDLSGSASTPPGNPLQLLSALQMAGLFQVVMMMVDAVREHFGAAGLLTSAAVLGLTDVDALTISMVKSAQTGSAVATAAKAIAIGMVANTLFKGAVAVVLGKGSFRVWTVVGLLVLAVVSGAALWVVG
ncbi:MAG: DUF4010 domain-containing protein [Acidobacteriota bacterium]